MAKLEELNSMEIDTLLTIVHDKYGYDFKKYAKASQRRHLLNYLKRKNFSVFHDLLGALDSDRNALPELVNGLTTSTTELFRDPLFFKSFRKNVIPYLETYPTFKIWHAGCSTGEEVFSMAIILKEAEILKHALLYGTDINAYVVSKAKKGEVPIHVLRRDTSNYFEANCKASLHEYWKIDGEAATLDNAILKRIVFGEHNLTTDCGFGEMQVICCRNVLIYFEKELQIKVLELLSSCLVGHGYLCLGSREFLISSFIEKYFEVVDRSARIYKKKLQIPKQGEN